MDLQSSSLVMASLVEVVSWKLLIQQLFQKVRREAQYCPYLFMVTNSIFFFDKNAS